jgi:tight adherence protein B
VRRLAFLVLLVPLLAAGPAAAAGPTLTGTSESAFPNRSYVLSLPHARKLDPAAVQVRENGREVPGLSVLPANTAGTKELAEVLVIDTSGSMRGAPIRGAVEAARVFASHRNSQQQLGIVEFNGRVRTALPLTTDQASIDRALASTPRLGRNTHIYDAVQAALAMLKAGHIAGGAVILLSDGSDTGSSARATAVEAAAQAAGVRVFTVGLRSGAFDRGTLAGLAAGSSGTFSVAGSSAELARIYDQLGSELASQYVIRYRSDARPHTLVRVDVTLPGTGSASLTYHTPALPIHPSPPFKRPFWQSAGAPAIFSLLSAALIAFAVIMVLRAQPARRHVRARVAQFVSPAAAPSEPGRAALAHRMLAGAERSLDGREWWARFKEDLDVAGIEMPAVEILALTGVGTVIMLVALVAPTGSPVLGILAFLVPLSVWLTVERKSDHQRKLFADQLADTLQVIASAIRAGQSFVGALSVAVADAPEPTRREFERVVADERLGIPLDNGLSVVARRMKNRDLEQIELVAALQRQTGGNMAEVLERAADTIRERAELRRLVKTLTAQGRLSRWVVSAIPPVLLAIISVINSSYVSPLFTTAAGHMVLVLCAVFIVAGSLVIRRIVNIEV